MKPRVSRGPDLTSRTSNMAMPRFTLVFPDRGVFRIRSKYKMAGIPSEIAQNKLNTLKSPAAVTDLAMSMENS